MYIGRMEEKKTAFKILTDTQNEERSSGRQSRHWRDNIHLFSVQDKIDLASRNFGQSGGTRAHGRKSLNMLFSLSLSLTLSVLCRMRKTGRNSNKTQGDLIVNGI